MFFNLSATTIHQQERSVWLQILVAEGLHPFYDERVRDLMDFKLYLDISDDVKFAWKMQRDSQERGHSEESIKQSIESRKPDFDAYIDPQKKHADIILQVCFEQLQGIWLLVLCQTCTCLQPSITHAGHSCKSLVTATRRQLHINMWNEKCTSVSLLRSQSGDMHGELQIKKCNLCLCRQCANCVCRQYPMHQAVKLGVCMQVLPTQLIPDEKEGKVLRVRLIQKEGIKLFNPSFLFDEGSTISWIPCGRKLTCSFPGIKFFYGPDTYYGEEVSLCTHFWEIKSGVL